MALEDHFKRQACNAIRDAHNLVRDAFADIGNTYRAVHMQHTGWITSGRYHHMDASHDIAQQEAINAAENGPQLSMNGSQTPDPGIGGRTRMVEIQSPRFSSPVQTPTIGPSESGPPDKNFTFYMGGNSYRGPGGSPPQGPQPDEPEIEP